MRATREKEDRYTRTEFFHVETSGTLMVGKILIRGFKNTKDIFYFVRRRRDLKLIKEREIVNLKFSVAVQKWF